MKSNKLKITKNIYLLVGCIIIMLTVIYNLSKLHSIYVLADEFGYWTSASFFRGYDWTDIAAMNPYYSFGYGILLAPLLWLQNGVLSYQGAIILNGILLCLSFLLSSHCLSILFNTLRTEYSVCISAAVTLYASNVGLSQTTMCESFLFFLFWCTFTCLLKICSKKRNKYIVLYAISLGSIYAVHLRTLGIIITGVLCLLILWRKKIINYKQLLIFILVFSVFLITGNILKEIIQTTYSSNLTSNVNDYAGQIDKIKFLFSITGLKSFIKSIFGKVWYLSASTLLLILWFVIVCVKTIRLKSLLFSKDFNRLPFLLFFLVLSLLTTLGISSLFMINPTRIDMIIYGRYNEFLLGPILSITLCWLMTQKKYLLKESGVTFFLFILFSIITYKIFLNFDYTEINYTNIIGIYRFIRNDFSIITISAKCFTCSLVIYFLAVIIRKIFKNIHWLCTLSVILCLCFLTGLWVWQGTGYSKDKVYTYQENLTDTVIADIINAINKDENIPIYYIYSPESTTYIRNRIFTVQFQLKETSIHLIDFDTFTKTKKNIDPNALYIINKNLTAIDELNYEYDVLFIGNNLELFTNYDNPQKTTIYEAVAKQIMSFDLNKTAANLGGEKTKTISLGQTNTSGCYQLNIFLNFADSIDWQTVKITLCTSSGNILDEEYIQNDELNNQQTEVLLSADISFNIETLKLILSSDEDFELRDISASISRVGSTKHEGADSKNELTEMADKAQHLNISDIEYITFAEHIGEMDIMQEIFNNITLKHKNYNDLISQIDSSKYILIKSEGDIFDYEALWESYGIVAVNDKYYLAVSRENQEPIQDWIAQGHSILSGPSGISAKCFDYTKFPIQNLYELRDLPDGNYVGTLELELVGDHTAAEKIASISYPNKDCVDIYYEDLVDGKYQFIIANGLSGEKFINIETAPDISIKNLWLKKSEYGDTIEAFYKSILNRLPDQHGYRDWLKWLNSDKATLISLCRSMFLSEEFTARNLNNEEYIKLLYSICLGTKNTDENYNSYIETLENGGNRSEMLEIFLTSDNCILK